MIAQAGGFFKNSEVEQLVARRVHIPEVVGSNPALASKCIHNGNK